MGNSRPQKSTPQAQPFEEYRPPNWSLPLGNYAEGDRAGKTLPMSLDDHILLIGGTGAGKSSRILMRMLLTTRDRSVIVFDPKGELAAVTARYRRSVGTVVIIDPYGVHTRAGSGFNPVGTFDANSPHLFDQSSELTQALIRIDKVQPHFSESAKDLWNGIIMWDVHLAKREGRTPSLANARRMLTEADEYDMGPNGKKRLIKGVKFNIAQACLEGGPEIESLLGRFLTSNDEIAGIRSTADNQSAWMLSPPMSDSLSRHDLDFAELKNRPTTVYVIMPPNRIRQNAPWLRMIVTCALQRLHTHGGLRTLLMIDEMAQLGHLPIMVDAFSLYRGVRIQVLGVLQAASQLVSAYGKDDAGTILSNSGVRQAFAPRLIEDAEWMSAQTGNTTDVMSGFTKGSQVNPNGPGSSDGMSYHQFKRPLYTPEKLMKMPDGSGVLWAKGATIPFVAPPYWEIPELAARADPNPYYE